MNHFFQFTNGELLRSYETTSQSVFFISQLFENVSGPVLLEATVIKANFLPKSCECVPMKAQSESV